MKIKVYIGFTMAGVLLALFLLLILALRTVDVRQIGPMSTSVGLSTVNSFVFRLFGVNMIWYSITDWLGIAGIFTAFAFAVVGVLELIKRKNLIKVDSQIIILGFIYLLIIGLYIFFEINIVNYRPIIMYKNPEASFPSSHTMITTAIMSCAMYAYRSYIKKKSLLIVSDCFCFTVISITIFGRLVSGVHWFTDIIGGLLLSGAILIFYISLCRLVKIKRAKKVEQK